MRLDILQDALIETQGDRRTRYREVVEDFVCSALSLSPLTTNGKCGICFDARKDGVLYEIKSVTGQPLVCKSRLRKELAFKGGPVVYAFLFHSVTRAGSVREIWEQLSRKIPTIHLVPLELVSKVVGRRFQCRRTINPSYRSSFSEGYREGEWKLGLYQLERLVPEEDRSNKTILFTRYGFDCRVKVVDWGTGSINEKVDCETLAETKEESKNNPGQREPVQTI